VVRLGESRIYAQGVGVWLQIFFEIKKDLRTYNAKVLILNVCSHETVFFMAFADKHPKLLEEPSEVKETLVRFIFLYRFLKL